MSNGEANFDLSGNIDSPPTYHAATTGAKTGLPVSSGDTKVDLSGNLDVPTPAATSAKTGVMEALSAVPVTPGAAKDWVLSRRKYVRPWSEFLNTARFSKPTNVAAVGSRAVKNIEHFMSNYLFVFLGLIVFCILTSPILLIVLGLCGGAIYYVGVKSQSQQNVKLFGRELTPSQQYAAIGVSSVPLLWLSGAGGAVFWILGASIFLIGLHAVFYKRLDESDAFDLEMDEVTVS
ncbi:prenylated Rab acceptor protein 1-like [Watersipora subatra]|uniref:prenylated Rab acceptor protein 1-like n=1 Tax=Watersipora subatra TaxID=2589382 RepID=UPI00355BF03B